QLWCRPAPHLHRRAGEPADVGGEQRRRPALRTDVARALSRASQTGAHAGLDRTKHVRVVYELPAGRPALPAGVDERAAGAADGIQIATEWPASRASPGGDWRARTTPTTTIGAYIHSRAATAKCSV